MPGTVEFGAIQDKDGGYRPCIEIRDENGTTVTFAADISFVNGADCRAACYVFQAILSNKTEEPLQYCEEGFDA